VINAVGQLTGERTETIEREGNFSGWSTQGGLNEAQQAWRRSPMMTRKKSHAEDGIKMKLVAEEEFHTPRVSLRDSVVNLTIAR
jgi:hypothetical protein